MNRCIRVAAMAMISLTLGATTPALAQDDELVRERVKVDDLNLRSPQGMKTFHDRVQAAANSICGSTGAGVRNSDALASERTCREQVTRGGDAQAAAMLAQQDAAQRSARAGAATPSHAIPYRKLRRTTHKASAHHRRAHATRRTPHTPARP